MVIPAGGWLVMPAALVELVAFAVHLEDRDAVCEVVDRRAGEALGAEHAGPLIERQIAVFYGGPALLALAEDLEGHLAGGACSHIAIRFPYLYSVSVNMGEHTYAYLHRWWHA